MAQRRKNLARFKMRRKQMAAQNAIIDFIESIQNPVHRNGVFYWGRYGI